MERTTSGGVTVHGAKLMAEALGGTKTVCTVTQCFRTFLYEFPASHFPSEAPDILHVVCDTEVCKAAVVTDLVGYFENGHARFSHFAIDVSLRDGISRAYRDQISNPNRTTKPIFLVVEQRESVPATTFDRGECYLVDERRNGEEIIEGGRARERALVAFRTANGAWPDFSSDMHAVNTVLAAVKAEQNVTHSIDPLYSCSCLVSDDHRAVYTMYPTINIAYGGPRVSSPVDAVGIQEKVSRIGSIHQGLSRDSETKPQIDELIESILWDKTMDDRHFRLWYLRLWQGLADAKRLLGVPDLEERSDVIAGNLTAQELKNYRDSIAHWWTGQVDYAYITGIQQTATELLRRTYGKQASN